MAYTGPSIVDYLNTEKQDSSFANRINLANQVGIKDYTGTAEQNTQLLNTLRNKPAIPSVLTAENLNNPPTVNVPPPPANNIPDISSLPTTDINQQAKDFAANAVSANVAPPEVEKTRDTLQQRVLDIAQRLTGRKAAEVAAAEKANVPQYQQQLNDINAQIRQLQTEYQQKAIQMEGAAGERGISTGILGRQLTQLDRDRAVKALGLSSIGQYLQGKLAYAQDLANKAVEAEFEPLQAQLDYFQLALQMNKDEFARVSEKRKEELKLQLDERQRLLNQQQADKKEIYKTAQEAAKNNADSLTVSKILASKSLDEATSLATPFLGAEFRQKELQQQFENSVESQKLAIEKIKTLKSLGTADGISNLTQSIIDNPQLFSSLTATKKGLVIAELQKNNYDTSNLNTKPLSDTAIAKISETQSGIDILKELKNTIQGKTSQLGPIVGLEALNPWSEKRKLQASVDLARQKVGKALEGGVLRKEDEEKYKKILANLVDKPSTALYKIDSLIGTLQRDIETYTSLQQSGGRSLDINEPLTKKGEKISSPEELRKKYNY